LRFRCLRRHSCAAGPVEQGVGHGHEPQGQQRADAQAAHDDDGHGVPEFPSEQGQRQQADHGGRGGDEDGPDAEDGRGDGRLVDAKPALALLGDAVDHDDAVVDDDPRQGKDAEQGREFEMRPEEVQPDYRPDDDERDGRHDQGRLAEGVELEQQQDEHPQQAVRGVAEQLRAGFGRVGDFPAGPRA
jgi:hypothetical protein